jgi:hypothetical protein
VYFAMGATMTIQDRAERYADSVAERVRVLSGRDVSPGTVPQLASIAESCGFEVFELFPERFSAA